MRVSASKRVTRSRADSAYAATKPATPLPMTATERSKECIRSMPGIRNRTAGGLVRYVPPVSSTFFRGGTIWTGVNGQGTDALLVIDGAVQAVGEAAHAQAKGGEEVELGGGFLMPSCGDGHAPPMPCGFYVFGEQAPHYNSTLSLHADRTRFPSHS